MVAILFAFTYWVYYIFYGEKNKKVGKEQKNKTYQLPPPENYFLTYYNPWYIMNEFFCLKKKYFVIKIFVFLENPQLKICDAFADIKKRFWLFL